MSARGWLLRLYRHQRRGDANLARRWAPMLRIIETRSLDATGIQAALAGSLPFSENVMWRCA